MDKLYVKIKCSMCSGTRVFNHNGYHDPLNPLKWKSCPYCDHDGLILIEAVAQTIVEHINEADEETKKYILDNIANRGEGS